MPYGTSGAIMPLYSPAGVFGWPGPCGAPGRFGGVFPAAFASSTALFQAARRRVVPLLRRRIFGQHLVPIVAHMTSAPGRIASASLDVHDCAGVPPQSLSISPIGTCRFCCRCRPKKYSTAEKLFTDRGRADLPRPDHILGRLVGDRLLHLKQVDHRIVRAGDFFIVIDRRLQAELHVRLAGAEPDFAHQYIVYDRWNC